MKQFRIFRPIRAARPPRLSAAAKRQMIAVKQQEAQKHNVFLDIDGKVFLDINGKAFLAR